MGVRCITPGYNCRLDEIRSALGINQLKRITKNNLRRKKAVLYYNSKLKNNESVIIPKILKEEAHACHLYILRIKKDGKFSRDYLFQKLLKTVLEVLFTTNQYMNLLHIRKMQK